MQGGWRGEVVWKLMARGWWWIGAVGRVEGGDQRWGGEGHCEGSGEVKECVSWWQGVVGGFVQ